MEEKGNKMLKSRTPTERSPGEQVKAESHCAAAGERPETFAGLRPRLAGAVLNVHEEFFRRLFSSKVTK